MITKKTIGVLAGGRSAEREVSLKSGEAIYKALVSCGYDAVFIDVLDNLSDSLKENGVEIAFISLHGGSGENGDVQGLLEVMGIPYTGSGVLASTLAMDKEASKKVFLCHDISVPPFGVVRKEQIWINGKLNLDSITPIVNFSLPWVIKPVAGGSSIGISIVRDKARIAELIDLTFSYGDKIIIEKYIEGKEIHIGIFGQRVLGGVEVKPLTGFYSYEAKYTPGITQYILPPEVDDSTYETLKMVALKAHNALGCEGVTRVDMILDEYNNPYVLEVNTIPGMTETSLLPKIARLSGMEFPDLAEEMLKAAMTRP
ncbi:D-alanine--D-alanine ligase [Thermodesulfovibrionales bacterium]|nr:D-alanine--D-alanine ligase [Thermodesulfovibrionales bacterium]MCL0033950.1 D-alanine--D-alanine ligase [Thermodesulfovibrionales bacterium]MCL0039964.1 D-alanine--D-alanine ligase [Thermodesulfovibrionales bacterium]MCL0083084.1 D-alanine--D-alanine ligase [Thermodesulfovibrionales bacterium]MCL0084841.1 D-alanine--D-alanine ligase [Thermodesulfovibrionales bacterium]